MPLIERYVFRTTALAFLAALAAITGVVWVTQALREVDLVTAQGQTLWLFLTITGLGLPSLVAIVAPVALFIAALQVLNRLNGDSELVVMSATGSSAARLLRPFLLLAALVSVLVGTLSVYTVPKTLRLVREAVSNVRADLVSNILAEGAFSTLDRGLTVHVRDRGPGIALNGIMVHDERDPAQALTYLAERGHLSQEGGRTVLVLERGSVQRHEAGAQNAGIVVFDRYAFDLSELASAAEVTSYKPRERYTFELLAPDPNDPASAGAPGRFRAELHDRLVSPLYPVAFVIVAFAAMGRAHTTRQSRGLAALVATAIVLALRIAGLGATNLVARAPEALILLYGLPLGAIVIGLCVIFGWFDGLRGLSFRPAAARA